MLKIAIIGAGQVARKSHLKYYQMMEHVKVAAVCDTNLETAKRTALEFGIPDYYSSHMEMLEQVKPNAVSVCVPNKFHCAVTCDALEHGCHVLCEKPPAIGAGEVIKMWNTAQRTGRKLTFGFHLRHAEPVSILKRMIEAGGLGTIYSAEAEWVRRRGIPGWGNFTSKEIQGGGPLIDIGIHMLDAAVYLMDYPKIDYVCATASNRIGICGGTGLMGSWDGSRFTVEDGLFGFIKFTGGSSLSLKTSFALNIAEKERKNIRLYADQCGASVFPLELYGEKDGRQINTAYPFEETKDWHYDCIRNFTDSINGRADLVVTAEQAVYVQKLTDSLYQSAESGKPVIYRQGEL